MSQSQKRIRPLTFHHIPRPNLFAEESTARLRCLDGHLPSARKKAVQILVRSDRYKEQYHGIAKHGISDLNRWKMLKSCPKSHCHQVLLLFSCLDYCTGHSFYSISTLGDGPGSRSLAQQVHSKCSSAPTAWDMFGASESLHGTAWSPVQHFLSPESFPEVVNISWTRSAVRFWLALDSLPLEKDDGWVFLHCQHLQHFRVPHFGSWFW